MSARTSFYLIGSSRQNIKRASRRSVRAAAHGAPPPRRTLSLFWSTPDELKLMINNTGLKIEKEMGQVVCSQVEAAKFRGRLNKPLNSKTFQYWLEGQNGKKVVSNFFKVIEAPVMPGQTTLTHIFVVKK